MYYKLHQLSVNRYTTLLVLYTPDAVMKRQNAYTEVDINHKLSGPCYYSRFNGHEEKTNNNFLTFHKFQEAKFNVKKITSFKIKCSVQKSNIYTVKNNYRVHGAINDIIISMKWVVLKKFLGQSSGFC